MSIIDEAWQAWLNRPREQSFYSTEDVFKAGYRRALEDAADAWQQGQWADALSGTQRPTAAQARLATAQAVTDWLRESAEDSAEAVTSA